MIKNRRCKWKIELWFESQFLQPLDQLAGSFLHWAVLFVDRHNLNWFFWGFRHGLETEISNWWFQILFRPTMYVRPLDVWCYKYFCRNNWNLIVLMLYWYLMINYCIRKLVVLIFDNCCIRKLIVLLSDSYCTRKLLVLISENLIEKKQNSDLIVLILSENLIENKFWNSNSNNIALTSILRKQRVNLVW